MNTTHLHALETRLSHERARCAGDNSELRAVWIKQIEREIARERAHLGLTVEPAVNMSDDELLAALEG